MGVIEHTVKSESERKGSALINSRVKIVGYGDSRRNMNSSVISQPKNINDTAITNDNVSAARGQVVDLPSISMHKK